MEMETLNLLINAGIAGVFAVFAIVLFREFIKFLDKQTASWQQFLAEQREQHNAALSRLAEEIKDVGKALAIHDDRTAEYIAKNSKGPRSRRRAAAATK